MLKNIIENFIYEAYTLLDEGRDNKSLKEATVNFAIELGFDKEYPWLHDTLSDIQVHHLDGKTNNHSLNNLGLIPKDIHGKLHGHLRNKENIKYELSTNTEYNNWFLKKEKLLLTLVEIMQEVAKDIDK